MTHTLSLLGFMCGGLMISAAAPAAPIFSNAGPDPLSPGLATGNVTTSGVPAPPATAWSEVPSDGAVANAISGFSSHLTGITGAYRFADDFLIPAGVSWRLDEIAVFAYQTGSGGPATPFSGINIRLWNGVPGEAGSAVIFGDEVTNRLASSAALPLYRVFNTVALPLPAAPGTSRPIWETRATIGGLTLGPGTYWVDWQYTASDASREAFSPAISVAGQRTRPGSNARQFRTTGGGSWVEVVDTGKPASAPDVAQDLPFIIHGAVVPSCPGDADGDGSVGLTDVAITINYWGQSVPAGTSGDISGNGLVGLEDLAVVINNWGATCR